MILYITCKLDADDLRELIAYWSNEQAGAHPNDDDYAEHAGSKAQFFKKRLVRLEAERAKKETL